MSELEEFKKLAETQKRENAKLEGRLESLYEELGEEGFTSLESAKSDMTVLRKKISSMRKTFNNKVSKFKKDHAHEI